MSNARHRFDNGLRYRSEDHEHQTALTPPYVLEPVRAALGGIESDRGDPVLRAAAGRMRIAVGRQAVSDTGNQEKK